MLIIVDRKISREAKEKLASYGELLELATEGITYPAISGHPDIFFCQSAEKLIVAPNLPDHYFDQLKNHHIDYITGELPVGNVYPASARYNAVATSKYLIHNFRHTDFMITRTLEDLSLVHVDQGYCRCNLLPLKDDCFISSDEGIGKVLLRWSLLWERLHLTDRDSISPTETPSHRPRLHLNVSPQDILLEGFPHGFFGGCCGVWDDKVFVNGSLEFYKDGKIVREFLEGWKYNIIELFNGPLRDCGSIFAIRQT